MLLAIETDKYSSTINKTPILQSFTTLVIIIPTGNIYILNSFKSYKALHVVA